MLAALPADTLARVLALTQTQWTLVILLAVVWVISSLRIALHARKIGRNPWLWFFITLCFTALPALIVFNIAYFLSRRRDPLDRQPSARRAGPPQGAPPEGPPVRCPHCGKLIMPAELADEPPPRRCPRCRLPLDEAHTA